MNKVIRILLTPACILFFLIGLFIEPRYLYWAIAVILFILDFVFYSGRKQRIRYWLQEYRRYLIKNSGDEKKAITDLLEEFRQSKYGINLNVAEYFYIEPLIEEIIIREYKFDKYLRANDESRHNEIQKLRKEIELVKDEIIGSK